MKVLFICLGNICRSPIAEGVMRDFFLKKQIDLEIDSAGTSGYHIGESPDIRAIECLRKKGIDISGLKARQLRHEDYIYYDQLLVMDRNNLKDVVNNCPRRDLISKVRLFREFDSNPREQIIPDPYYGGDHEFENVYKLCVSATENFYLTHHFKPE